MQQLRPGLSIRGFVLLAVAAIAAITPFAPALGDLYNIWNLKPEYSHGIFIPMLSAFLIWRQRHELRELPFSGSWYGLIPIALGLGLRVVGDLTTMFTLVHYGFLLVLYGLVLTLTGPAVFRRLWMPLLMLVFMVPPPSFFSDALSLKLQLLSSALGVWVIRMAGISVLLEGNIIDLGSYQLQVAEACNGLRYLYPLMTLAFIVAYLFRGPLWKRITIFASSVPIAIVMNSVRIGVIGITVEHWGPRMAEGVLHEFEGWLVFMLSTGTLLLTALLLAKMGNRGAKLHEMLNIYPTPPRKDATSPAAAHPTSAPLPRSFVAAAALVVVGATAILTMPTRHEIRPSRDAFDDFPTRVGAWVGQRGTLENIYLDALKLDDYVMADYHESTGIPVNFYAAYYYSQDTSRAVHSPRNCIPGGGWEIARIERRNLPSVAGSGPLAANRVVIQQGERKQVVYYWFQQRGRRITNEYMVKWYLFWDALTRHRTDGALVRFVAPLPRGVPEAEADAKIARLASALQPQIARYMPD
ncbi:MAG: VPLPA-CTERM-specific exosortase XrtD [Gammaproteobacteria bacterium]